MSRNQVPSANGAEEAAKLKSLREAADAGIAAIDRGDYVQFERIDDLIAHLDAVAEQAISAARRR